MYEFLVLATLSRFPMHGYMMAKVLGNMMGPFRHLQWGALYPVLNRLQTEGLIRADESPEEGDARSRKVYSITDAGRRRLHEHVMDTERHAGEYDDVFPQKVALFSQLTSEERVHLARHYAVHAQQNIDHLQRKRADLVLNQQLSPEQRADIITVMDHRIEHWRHELAWAELLLARDRTTTKESA